MNKNVYLYILQFIGKARRLKQAKEEAQDEIEKYRQEREKQFKEFEAKVSGLIIFTFSSITLIMCSFLLATLTLQTS